MPKAIIPGNATTSRPVDLQTILTGHRLVAMRMPAAFTGTAITFLARENETGSSFVAVVDQAGAAVSITVAVDQYIVFDQDTAAQLEGLRFIELVSGSTETGEREIVLVTK